jgi:hypothetical protein
MGDALGKEKGARAHQSSRVTVRQRKRLGEAELHGGEGRLVVVGRSAPANPDEDGEGEG